MQIRARLTLYSNMYLPNPVSTSLDLISHIKYALRPASRAKNRNFSIRSQIWLTWVRVSLTPKYAGIHMQKTLMLIAPMNPAMPHLSLIAKPGLYNMREMRLTMICMRHCTCAGISISDPPFPGRYPYLDNP